MKKLILGLFLVTVAAPAINAFDATKLFQDIEKLVTTLIDSQKNITDLYKDSIKIKMFAACKKKSPAEREKAVVTSSSGIKVHCNNLKVPLDVVRSTLNLLGHSIIGSSEKPGIVYLVLSILNNAGVKISESKSIVGNISNLINMLNKLLAATENKLEVVTTEHSAAKPEPKK